MALSLPLTVFFFFKKILFIPLHLKIHVYLIGRHHKFHSSLFHYFKINHEETICIVQSYKGYPQNRTFLGYLQADQNIVFSLEPKILSHWLIQASNHICLLSHFENQKPFRCTLKNSILKILSFFSSLFSAVLFFIPLIKKTKKKKEPFKTITTVK